MMSHEPSINPLSRESDRGLKSSKDHQPRILDFTAALAIAKNSLRISIRYPANFIIWGILPLLWLLPFVFTATAFSGGLSNPIFGSQTGYTEFIPFLVLGCVQLRRQQHMGYWQYTTLVSICGSARANVPYSCSSPFNFIRCCHRGVNYHILQHNHPLHNLCSHIWVEFLLYCNISSITYPDHDDSSVHRICFRFFRNYPRL